MNNRIVFATSRDGARIAAGVMGSGYPLVVLHIPAFSHARLALTVPRYRAWYDRLGRTREVIRIDLRGSGLSDRDQAVHTFADYVADIEAIYKALGIEAADIMAIGLRSPVAIRFAARHPERVRRLVLNAVTVGPNAASGRPMVEAAARQLAATDWRLYMETLAARLNFGEPNVAEMAGFMHECCDQPGMLAMMECLNQEDIRDDLPLLSCPTLVGELEQNTLITAGHAERFLSLVPHARIVWIPNVSGALIQELTAAFEQWEAELNSAARVPQPTQLTDREKDVLRLLAIGRKNAEIASALTLSRATVDRHVANIYAKARVRNRAEATLWAVANGIVSPPPT